MATSDPSAARRALADVLAALRPGPDPVEQQDLLSADDLARLPVERMIIESGGLRTSLRSRGSLRLHGPGVGDSSAPMADVGVVMDQWQRLVTAIGAKLVGEDSKRGKVSAKVEAATRLQLTATIAGSVVLHLESAPLDEAQDALPVGDSDVRSLADLAMVDALDLLSHVTGQVVFDDLEGSLVDRGPRIASSLRDVLLRLGKAGFDADVSWSEKTRPTRRVSVSATDAAAAALAIKSRRLADEPVKLVGSFLTISTRRRMELQELGSEELISLTHAQIPTEQIAGLTIGDVVEVDALATESRSAGGVISREYEAIALRVRQPLIGT